MPSKCIRWTQWKKHGHTPAQRHILQVSADTWSARHSAGGTRMCSCALLCKAPAGVYAPMCTLGCVCVCVCVCVCASMARLAQHRSACHGHQRACLCVCVCACVCLGVVFEGHFRVRKDRLVSSPALSHIPSGIAPLRPHGRALPPRLSLRLRQGLPPVLETESLVGGSRGQREPPPDRQAPSGRAPCFERPLCGPLPPAPSFGPLCGPALPTFWCQWPDEFAFFLVISALPAPFVFADVVRFAVLALVYRTKCAWAFTPMARNLLSMR